jgi:hypothetical protein
VIAWDGPDRGYTVRLLGKKESVSGVAGADIYCLFSTSGRGGCENGGW